MSQELVEHVPAEVHGTEASDDRANALGEIPAINTAEATSFAEIEQQANQLLDYISKLGSFAEDAYDTAIRQTESAQRSEEDHQSELNSLRIQLEAKTALLEDRRRELANRQDNSHEQVAALENRLAEREKEIDEKNNELKHLRTEITLLLNRLNEIQEAMKQSENQRQERVEPLNQEIAVLKTQLAQRDETIQAKNNLLRKAETDYRANSTQVEQKLRDAETQLQSQETHLKEKDAVIQATAVKEAEIGKLIKRLSTECEHLNAELQEKTRLLNQGGDKKSAAAADAKGWRRVIGRLQEEEL